MTDIILESERLYLKEFTLDDTDNFFRLNSDPEVMKYILPPVTDINVIIKSIKKIRKYYTENPGLGVWAGYEKHSDEFIGFFELAHLDNTEEIEVGYRIHKKYWNKGYATEMTKVLIDYEFNIMKLDQIAGITHPENIASQKVLTKSGLIYVTDAFFYDSDVKYYEIDRTKYKMIGKLNIRNNVKSK
ncbi:GNAT family N-acetyltransferase [bacterium]|nr:GNAT family N-acetyltransferase [bacterium]